MDSNLVQIKVEDTNSEAMIAKISATKKGYFIDEFAEQFVKAPQGKKDVIIHRGYWCRYHIFNRLVSSFLTAGTGPRLIISLGCGYDTMPFLMLQQYPEIDFRYLEIDLPQVIKQKVIKIDKSSKIKSLLTSQAVFDFDTYQIKDSKYGIFGLDLVKVEQLRATLEDFKVDFKVPTLIFAECVLTYINTESTTQLLHGIASWFPTLTFINYEMFNGSDLFGKMMVRNFEARGCMLAGIDSFPTMAAHVERLTKVGFKHTEIDDMKQLYQKATDPAEKARIEKIEMLDEWEEWNIMQTHYFISVSTNFDGDSEANQAIQAGVRLKLQ